MAFLAAGLLPNTEEAGNWTVVVFKCPRKNWTETPNKLFSRLDEQKLALMPNYTLRRYEESSDSFFVSFRILREQRHEKAIRDLVDSCLEDLEHEFDPQEPSPFAQYHEWRSTVGWTRERCEILSKISRFTLDITRSDTSLERRLDWTHLFSNMTAIFDIERSYHNPEVVFPKICWVKYHPFPFSWRKNEQTTQ